MLFETVSVSDAEGAILAHSLRLDGTLLRKGRKLSTDDLRAIAQNGVEQITVARLNADDVPENEAAARIAEMLIGAGMRAGASFTGRSNLYATEHGLLIMDAARIDAANAIDEAATVATLAPFSPVKPGQMLATIKIIPFAAPASVVTRIEHALAKNALHVALFMPRKAALISTVMPGTKTSMLNKNRATIEARLKDVGSSLEFEERVAHSVGPLAQSIGKAKTAGCDPILIFGASAITDRRDVIPAALEEAGGRIEHFGMPVDPGNLLMIGQMDGTKVVGLPGCARSPKLNGFDFVLWRLAAGLPIGRAEISAMGVGGLLTEISTRPQPRDEPITTYPHAAKIAAVILAAGMSSRMGSNKLLAELNGEPLIRHAVRAAITSHAEPVIVVTGKDAEQVRSALNGMQVQFVDNSDYSKGLSASLRAGVNAVPAECDGALILLGDMPGISAPLIDRLVAAFDLSEDRAIVVATRHGKQGNPVLWARRFFAEMGAIEGDVGARNLIGLHSEMVCEVEADDDAPLTDIDTPQMLEAYRAR